MKTKNFVIGGGLSGLIWAALNPDYRVVCGTAPTMVQRGVSPLVLHYDERIAEFVQSVYNEGRKAEGQPPEEVKPSTCMVEHCTMGKPWYGYTFTRSLGADAAERYFLKSRELATTDRDFTNVVNRSFDYFDMGLGCFERGLRRMIGEKRFISAIVSGIFETHIVAARLGEHEPIHLEYDSLVSTLTAPQFFYFWQLGLEAERPKFEYRGKKYTYTTTEEFPVPKWMKETRRRGYVYYPDETPSGLLRVSNLGPTWVAEFAESVPVVGAKEIPIAYFLAPEKVISPLPDRIKFFGRFAEWDEELLAHNLVLRLV